ncbi:MULTISPECIES: amidohydrolase family protein [unclassified Colwellia]|uniref:amidohydrolase family protein n=1 Tax=unclassified Colwellia TaxID=196834 RepID=UPI0015F47379|nr:amidohydrolase family protein [Colwellia sp. MB02u-7]MBA6236598.1 amidohydrolase family protein [Colwellia sp. MB02u-11]MBA6257137.1 amidohydrolase family protein [Colwellia sp. MB3u-28]MBA6258631.1 amidohydrolase family protein [Colwellia sp. MB3u-41]MBA6298003.1 amidohydrolase family protein [Colwellia sp. MB3u-22]MBA6303738.1 amidohydrolase family protein [Colwellia sp. MB02u-14]MBA6312173.1 amidohydrolase family protein [Colwellia sp. MB3u-64]
MKLFKASLVALALAAISHANAESLAITNATIHTVTEQGVLTNATVVIDDGKIIAINPEKIDADVTFDAMGKILTPGLIGAMNSLGLVEVNAVSRTRDASDKKADITFDASIAFNPRSTVVPYTRKGGITSNVSVPSGGDSMFKGQTFVTDLSGEFDSVYLKENAVIIDLGAKSSGSRALNLQKLRYTLEDAKKSLTKAAEDAKTAKKDKKADDKQKEPKELKRDAKIINALLTGDKPLVAYADRATDLLELLKLKAEFNLDLVIAGGADAILITEQLAAAKVPVIFGALDNLPSSFDSLHSSLDNTAKLTQAGINVALAINDAHNLYQLRFEAGNAIANGLTKDQALAAVTANVADAFNINAGRIAVGKKADLVLWSADPFELSTKVDKMWIDGKEISTQSRQDKLRKRYTTESDMPRGYTK